MTRPMREDYIVQIEDSLLAAFIACWLDYDKPCQLLFQRPHTDGLCAIRLTLDTGAPMSVMFLAKAIKTTSCKVHYTRK